jgi:ABC-type transport system involved in Fe-S cluster assembly fused permease/ATPase subunit
VGLLMMLTYVLVLVLISPWLLAGSSSNEACRPAVRPQTASRPHATISANISSCTAGATLSQMKAACQKAQAAGFIEGLPMGYDTLVNERG